MMDEAFEQEQAHLSEVYAKLEQIRDDLTADIESDHEGAAQDLRDMSEEIRFNFSSHDETMETLAAIETLNSVIDAYNQYHDFKLDELRRAILLLRQPYFAKVTLKMRPGRPPRDVYIGAAGMTDERSIPFIVDWRSPVAETYYNQQMGETSYLVDGKVRTVELMLRRQFDIVRDKLNMYFDTTVAIEDSLLLSALKANHTEKLKAITATIQREQNTVVRHEDVPVLLVSGIAGSGKTSVMLQRIAYLFYNERKTLDPKQVFLFTPNQMFVRYIDTVLPTLGESNPQTVTWDGFMASLGLSDRNSGAEGDAAELAELEAAVSGMEIEQADLREIAIDGVKLLTTAQIKNALDKFSRIPVGPRLAALVEEELHEKLERRFDALAKDDEIQEEMLGLDIDDQLEYFDSTIAPYDEEETRALARIYVSKRFASAHDAIDTAAWLRIDRIGMRLLGRSDLTAAEWLYTKLLVAGGQAKHVRYVMVDEVQDYTAVQLMVLARYFSQAHFLLLGDENQAIFEHAASFDEIRAIFSKVHGDVAECALTTSYRSSPEITALFASLLDDGVARNLSSVQREGTKPQVIVAPDRDGYLAELRRLVEEASGEDGLAAIIVQRKETAHWLKKQLGDSVRALERTDTLPARGVVLLTLALAKGLEFDQVIVADADGRDYPETPLARRRLYTAISRAMHKVALLAQGELTPLMQEP
jgi:DNA helicase-2/ATP-dependent DNA helicase PcrA